MEKNENGNNSQDPQEGGVIVIENPETIERDVYSGEIVSIHNGYVFIHNVKRGYETIITNGDVFSPVPEDSKFEVGQLVQFFDLNPDKERFGKFRTEKISLVETGLDLNSPSGRIAAIVNLSKTVSSYHRLKKVIDEGDIEKAKQNKPLVEFIQQIGFILNNGYNSYNPDEIIRLTEDFVAKTFSMLTPLGVKCSILGDVDVDAEIKMIEETIKLYDEDGLRGQSESLRREYSNFTGVRDVFTLMNDNNLLNYSSVIDIKYLPELTFAFPVWFVNGRNQLQDLTNETDPKVDHAVKFFANSVGSEEYAWFYQIYNRRTRPFYQFKGRDIMPPNLVKIMRKAKELFDYVVIMTPYHDIASREWSDPNWLRNIDPIMVGFLEGIPHMFILGRWSGTGVFPMLLDCIADTANHLKLNKHLLSNFAYSTYWYMGRSASYLSRTISNGLVPFADKLLLSYENGVLFPFLRGELKENDEYKF